MPRRTDLNDIRAILRRDADETLVAAAGTHLLSRRERVATIGNVYTRRDCRGRGLGRTVMSAVLEALADIDTIGLNVRVDNRAAIRVYASLGFVRHCPFYKRSRREPVGFPTRRPPGCSLLAPGQTNASSETPLGHFVHLQLGAVPAA